MHEADAYLLLHGDLDLVSSELDSCAFAISVWLELANDYPFSELQVSRAKELLEYASIALPNETMRRIIGPSSPQSVEQYQELLLETSLSVAAYTQLVLEHMLGTLQREPVLRFAEGPWRDLIDTCRSFAELVIAPMNEEAATAATALLDELDTHQEQLERIGVVCLGYWGYFFFRESQLSEERLWRIIDDFGVTNEGLDEQLEQIINWVYGDPECSGRRPYRRQQHLEWKRLHEEEELSHAAIAQRHNRDNPEKPITRDAVAKAISRLRTEDI